MGLSTRHLSGRSFVRARGSFHLLDGSTMTSHAPDQLSFDRGRVRENPEENCVQLQDGSIVVPWAVSRLNKGATDDAPKLTLAAPDGDFSFGGQFVTEECLHVTWAGGSARNTTAVGHRWPIRFTDFDYAAGASAADWAIRRSAPAEGTYRFVFCLLSSAALPAAELAAKLDRLDLIRQGWEAGFTTIAPAAGSPRTADTRISAWP